MSNSIPARTLSPADIERTLRSLVQANTHLLSIHRDEHTTAFAAGYLAALQAVAESFGIEVLRDRSTR